MNQCALAEPAAYGLSAKGDRAAVNRTDRPFQQAFHHTKPVQRRFILMAQSLARRDTAFDQVMPDPGLSKLAEGAEPNEASD